MGMGLSAAMIRTDLFVEGGAFMFGIAQSTPATHPGRYPTRFVAGLEAWPVIGIGRVLLTGQGQQQPGFRVHRG